MQSETELGTTTAEETMLESAYTEGTKEKGERVGYKTRLWQEGLQKVTFSCEDLNVFATVKNGEVQILKSISSIFKPGTITALMGPSGAGKTTLLNVLSGIEGGGLSVEAKVLTLNGVAMTSSDVRRVSKLVPQVDTLMSVLSPRECLRYGAKLGLRKTDKEIEALVDKTLELLSLNSCADTICGDHEIKGISGGERKRVSIGLELISNPSCLFLDEPTSGLDAKVALDVVQTLRVLAEEGRTIVCTIHQPSYECFKNFDRLLLMRKGEVAFQGDTKNMSGYFDSIGYPCPQFKNPADHILNVVSMDDFAVDFKQDKLYQEFLQYQQDAGDGSELEGVQRRLEQPSEMKKIPILIKRAISVTFKDQKGFKTRIGQTIGISVILGLSYFQLGSNQTQYFDRLAALMMVASFIGMTSLIGTINAIPMEKAVLKREYNNGMYSVSSFYWSRLFVYCLFQVLYATIYTVLIYFLVGFSLEVDKFLVFYAMVLVASFIGVTLGFLFGSLFSTVVQATNMVPILIMPMTLFSGVLISVESMPLPLKFFYYISFVQYLLKIAVNNEFNGFEFNPCSEKDFDTPGECPFGLCLAPDLVQSNNSSFISGQCDGNVVVTSGDYDDLSVVECFIVLLVYLAVVVLLAYLAIYNLLNPISCRKNNRNTKQRGQINTSTVIDAVQKEAK